MCDTERFLSLQYVWEEEWGHIFIDYPRMKLAVYHVTSTGKAGDTDTNRVLFLDKKRIGFNSKDKQ